MICRIWDKENNRFWEDVNEGYNGKIEQLLVSPSGEVIMRTIDKMIHESMFPGRFVLNMRLKVNDKLGNGIYENDIVELAGDNGDIWVVQIGGYGPFLVDRIDSDDLEYYDNGDYYQGQQFDLEKAIVIGNIYQNKELIS
jgi:hypothetical protein